MPRVFTKIYIGRVPAVYGVSHKCRIKTSLERGHVASAHRFAISGRHTNGDVPDTPVPPMVDRPTTGRDARDHYGRADRRLQLVSLAGRPRCGAVGGRAAGARYRHWHGDGRQAVHKRRTSTCAAPTSGGTCCTWSTRRPARSDGGRHAGQLRARRQGAGPRVGSAADRREVRRQSGGEGRDARRQGSEPVSELRRSLGGQELPTASCRRSGRSRIASYEEIYPPGPGLDVLENAVHALPWRELLPAEPAQRRGMEVRPRLHDGQDPERAGQASSAKACSPARPATSGSASRTARTCSST